MEHTGWRYRPELDGLRSVAVYLVLLFHCGMTAMGGGFIGVDLFFVLSGFLVSHVILAEADGRGGRFSLGRFYARRVRRLLPAAVVVVVLTAAAQLVIADAAQRASLTGAARSALLYFSNWHFIGASTDYFAADHVASSPYLHFWSLSIEEQFYVGLPVLLLLLLRMRRHKTLMKVVVAALVVVSVGLQIWQASRDVTYAYYATETRLYQLAAGVLLCLFTRDVGTRQVPGGGWIATAGLSGLLLLGSGLLDLTPSWRGVAATVASVATIGGLFIAGSSPVARLLALPVPRYLGQISYGTYLWHWPVILLLLKVLDVRPLVLAAFATLFATGLAALSYQVLETPIRRAKKLDPWAWPVVAAGLAVSVLAAVAIVPALAHSDRRPGLSATKPSPPMYADQVPWLSDPLPKGLDLAAALDDVPAQTTPCSVDDPTACRVVEGAGERWLLVGDSQAQMTLDAFSGLARDHDLSLFTAIGRGCPWQLGLFNLTLPDADAAVCRQQREVFYRDVLPALDIDRIVVVNLSRTDERWREKLSDSAAGPSATALEELQETYGKQTLDLFRATGARVTFVRSLPGTNGYARSGPDPLACLGSARTLGECAVLLPSAHTFVDEFYAKWAKLPHVDVADLTPAVCPDGPLCRPVLDGVIVWKDPDHVTATVLDQRRDLIWKALEEVS